MAKIKTMKWIDANDEQGWGKITPTAWGVTYKYEVMGGDGNYSVTISPLINSIRLHEFTEKGFLTVEDAKYWAHEHNCKQIEQWLE